MPHIMFRFVFKDTAIKAMTDAPQDREEAARQVIQSFGGKMQSYYFCFGEFDGVGIAEFPDLVSAGACSMRVSGSGAFAKFETVPLLTTAEARNAMQKVKDAGAANYRPPTG